MTAFTKAPQILQTSNLILYIQVCEHAFDNVKLEVRLPINHLSQTPQTWELCSLNITFYFVSMSMGLRNLILKHEEEEGIPNTFLTMLLSPADMSIKSSANASELISLQSRKPNSFADIWTVNKSGF